MPVRSVCRPLARTALIIISLSVLLPSQDVPRLELKTTESIPIEPLAGFIATVGSPQCDGQGNVYYRLAMTAPADPMSGPVVRISADGRNTKSVDLHSVPGLPQKARMQATAPGLREEFYMLASADERSYLITFNDEANFDSLAEIEPQFSVMQVAVFPTGEFLGSGVKFPERRDDKRTPFTAIFDRNGKLIKLLNIPAGVDSKGDEGPRNELDAISLGEAVPAADGNIYLLRAASSPLIYVISPGGEIVRKMQLVPAEEGMTFGGMKVAGGSIVIAYFKPNHDSRNSGTYTYSLYDAQTGEPQIDYQTGADEGGIFACYVPGKFTFLSITDKGLVLVHAAPH